MLTAGLGLRLILPSELEVRLLAVFVVLACACFASFGLFGVIDGIGTRRFKNFYYDFVAYLHRQILKPFEMFIELICGARGQSAQGDL